MTAEAATIGSAIVTRHRAVIAATYLTKAFGVGSARTVAVDDAGFEAYFGEMLCVVGPSGSESWNLLLERGMVAAIAAAFGHAAVRRVLAPFDIFRG